MTATALIGIGLLATQDDEIGELTDAALIMVGDQIESVADVTSDSSLQKVRAFREGAESRSPRRASRSRWCLTT